MFITFEGLDFCGKSTQVNLLEAYLKDKGKQVKIIREPGGVQISEMIRNILLDKKNFKMSEETELLLFEASRSQLVRELILPFLDQEFYVISDRFHDSTTAYQGFGRSIPLEFIKVINNYAIGDTIPDLTFFIDIPVTEIAKRRNLRNNGELDRIESLNSQFYEKVRSGYLFLSENEKRFKRIDGLLSISEIHHKIVCEIDQYEMKGV
jgi:dTMP kinase